MPTPERIEIAPGYSIPRVLNGCWQLSPGSSPRGSRDPRGPVKST